MPITGYDADAEKITLRSGTRSRAFKAITALVLLASVRVGTGVGWLLKGWRF